ncbi:MAG: hypothetical protein NC341_12695 [Blautia sp.]|nr:hypothetical protein [Blautia sp.]MCM1200305.1 hypothetical protein [Bacteroides fragilis]
MKKLSLILAGVLTAGLLGGCGNSFDAAAYAKALLDNSYKNDSTQFVSMKIGTAEEAADLYEQGLDANVDAMVASAGGSITAEQAESFRQVFADIYGGAKYTVGEAEKQDDGSFVVTITYEQMNVFEPAMTAYMDEVNNMVEEWTAAATAGSELPSEDEMNEQIISAYRDCFVDSLANVTYDEPATATLRIELIDNVWTPNEDDVMNLEMVFFDMDDALSALQ